MKSIYLAGLISTEKQESLTWRRAARRKFFNDYEDKLVILDPMRGKWDLEQQSQNGGLTDPAFTSTDIIRRDYGDVSQADIILVNLNDFGSSRPLVGTIMELAWAWEQKKLVIAIAGPNVTWLRDHPFVKECVSHWFSSVDAAIEFIVGRIL